MPIKTDTILEFCDSRGLSLRIDREHGVIHGVKVLGLSSRNGREYPKETVARAASMYEGAKVNVNHPNGNPTGPRDYRDRLGTLRNVRVEQGDGGLRADFHFNPKHALAEQLLWDAEHAPENVGFSHNVEARTSRKNGKTFVEEITRVQSVDLVADPATTRGLFEHAANQSSEGSDILDYDKLTEAELRTHCPGLVKAIAEATLAAHANSEAEKAKDAKIKTLEEQIVAYKAKEAKAAAVAAIDAELAEAKLPAGLVSDVFRNTLLEAKDAAARKTLIEDRRKLFAGPNGSTGNPVSKEKQLTEGEAALGVTDSKSFARALTR